MRSTALLAALVLSGCAETSAPPAGGGPDSQADRSYVRCEDPRPEVCTQHYAPVCALRDTGIRCITTPCDSSEKKSYGNACLACSDPQVTAYAEGACEPEADQPSDAEGPRG